MPTPISATLPPSPATTERVCPFREGRETVDMLLAEIRDGEQLDAVLDLRSLIDAREDAGACVAQLFRVRGLLDGRHYLAFYRVRCWMRRLIVARVRPDRRTPWTTLQLPLGSARLNEVINTCLAATATNGDIPPAACVEFAFAATKAGCDVSP